MKNENKEKIVVNKGDDSIEINDRREFLKRVGKTALIAPAIALLVDASLKSKKANAKMYTYDPGWPDL